MTMHDCKSAQTQKNHGTASLLKPLQPLPFVMVVESQGVYQAPREHEALSTSSSSNIQSDYEIPAAKLGERLYQALF